MSGIRVSELAKRFGQRTAVEGLNFEVAPGEVFGLLGPNGAGKTTTVRMLAGLLEPSQGEAFVAGMSLRTHAQAVRQKVGLLTEQPGLYDRLTARENLEFFLRLHGRNSQEGWKSVRSNLERFGLGGREEEPVGTFSKGMRQKLALVRTLIHEPGVLLLDEPTSGLDPESARVVRTAILEWAAQGKCVVLCSHNLVEVERVCRRVAVVKNRQRQIGFVHELRRRENVLEVHVEGPAEKWANTLPEKALSKCIRYEGSVLQFSIPSETSVPDVVAALVNHHARVTRVALKERPLEDIYLEWVQQNEGADS